MTFKSMKENRARLMSFGAYFHYHVLIIVNVNLILVHGPQNVQNFSPISIEISCFED
jgi:hypothetical protein